MLEEVMYSTRCFPCHTNQLFCYVINGRKEFTSLHLYFQGGHSLSGKEAPDKSDQVN